MKFTNWLNTLIEEKGYDTEDVFEVEGPSGTNFIPLGCVIEAINQAPGHERAAIKTNLVKIDFMNGNCLDYFRHLAQVIAM